MTPRDSATILIAMFAAGIAVAKPVPPATPAGKPLDCVNTQDIRETRVRDDSTIDFYMLGNKVYRNKLPQSCPQLGFEERFGYSITNNQLCSVDIIHVIQSPPSIPGAACGLGDFQPITGAPR